MTRYLVILAVLDRWHKAQEQVRQQMYAARVPVIREQLAAMRGTYS